jgi:uncharacterized membrane protein YfcA
VVYLLYALASSVGGLLVGVLGTGSGLVVLPSLILIFAGVLPGFDTLRLAAGTTMATMAVGAIAGALTQYRAGHVDLQLLRLMLFPYVIGSLIGPWISRFLPAQVLGIYLSIIISIVALRMLFVGSGMTSSKRDYGAHRLEISLVLICVGICSSVAGVASGIFAIPYLTRFSLPMRTIIGTSTAGAAVYATFGAIGYISAGWSAEGLPAGAFGYIYLPAFAVMAVGASVFTPLGVRLARYVNERMLRRLFAVFLLAAALSIVFL